MGIQFTKPEHEIFIPDGAPENEAFARTTHAAFGAHQDDLEIMSLDGILKCYDQRSLWYLGVVVSNGSGASRDGMYAAYTDDELREVRRAEQRKAAFVGEYSACVQLMYTSREIKDGGNKATVRDIAEILRLSRPKTVYTHNLADKHDTHVAVALRVIEAIRSLPPGGRPERLYGCEVWRGLDWLCDDDKIIFDVSARSSVSASLVGVYDSQVQSKRYDRAALGRRMSNASFLDAFENDSMEEAVYGLDMSALITDEALDPAGFIAGYIDRLNNDVAKRLKNFI
jgi:LmbE family N-acetylglucosaminyl deacetylase